MKKLWSLIDLLLPAASVATANVVAARPEKCVLLTLAPTSVYTLLELNGCGR